MALASDFAEHTHEERMRADEMIFALVHKAGGEVELNIGNFVASKGLVLQRAEIGGGHGFLLRLIDPNAPVEGGHYWVKVDPDKTPDWIPATFKHGKWWAAGFPSSLVPQCVGERIPTPPVPPAPETSGSTPPEGYRQLAAGVRCKCIKSWTDEAGNHWCCLPPARATDGTTASGITPSV